MTAWLLVHSPLLGPGSWRPVAARLTATVPDLRPALAADQFAIGQADLAAHAVTPGTAVWLAGHSGAGPLLPLVADGLRRLEVHVLGTVFVDAGLPHPGVPRRATLGDDLIEHLDALTVDGWLPPWPQWWPADALAALVPDLATRSGLNDDSPQLPAALFTEPMPGSAEMPSPRYLQLSAAYSEEADAAERLGWPVRRLEADHLAVLTRPGEVAAAMEQLVTQ